MGILALVTLSSSGTPGAVRDDVRAAHAMATESKQGGQFVVLLTI